MAFDPSMLSVKDRSLVAEILSLRGHEDYLLPTSHYPQPDLNIAPDGSPYLYRWHVIPRNKAGNVYLHVQVASDPERPLHDHPWDNQSVILSGGYTEVVQHTPPYSRQTERARFAGQVIQRKAGEAHRLVLPSEVPYTMTLFTTGPVRRDWGFWLGTHRGIPEWVSHNECVIDLPDGRSIFKRPERLR